MEFKPPCQFVVGDNAAASWRQYKQQIEVYILAADLTEASDERKVAILLHCMGPEHLKTFNTFTWENNGDESKFKKVLEKFESHFEPKKHLGTCRGKFHARFQRQGETLTDFITDLKSMAEHCEFADLKG